MCIKPRMYRGQMCPCGKCEECIRTKANGVMQVLVDCAKRYNTLHFLTLTYNDINCPLYVRAVDCDKTRKDFKYSYQFNKYTRENNGTRPNKRMEDALRKEYKFLKANEKPTPNTVQEMTYKGRQYRVSASLCREDTKMIMKLFRQHYARIFKATGDERYNLNFKFYLRGEYGPQTARPHYHGLFFGLSDEHIAKFSEIWQAHFGRCLAEKVGRSEKDFTNSCRYVSNYINKASFEPQCIQEYVCERPRTQCSIGMAQLSAKEIDYYTGKDIVPSMHEEYYDPQDIERIYNRLKRTVGTSQYKLSDKYKKQLFYDKIKVIDFWTGEEKVRQIATPLQRAITAFVQLRHRADTYSELEEMEAQISNFEERRKAINAKYHHEEIGRLSRAKAGLRQLRQNVTKSRF